MADKTLLIKLKIAADGSAAASIIRSLGDTASAESRLEKQMASTNREAISQRAALEGVTSGLGRMFAMLGLSAALAVITKKTYDYNQELESQKNGMTGLLFANQNYVDSAGKAVDATVGWAAASAEATNLMAKLHEQSLKTAVTLPQISEAFQLVYGAVKQAGQSTKDLDPLVTLTTRLVQTASAFHLPIDRLREEVNTMFAGAISTRGSIIAHRLGLDDDQIHQLEANGKLVAEIIKRTEAYVPAAEAEANSVKGKIINTTEQVVATLSTAFEPLIQRMKGPLDWLFNYFGQHGGEITDFIQRAIAGFDAGVDAVGRFVEAHKQLLIDIGSVALIAGAVAGGYLLIASAIAAITSPVFLTIAGIVALAVVWEKVRKWSVIEVGGVPIIAYLREVNGALLFTFGSLANAVVGIAQLVGSTLQVIASAFVNVIVAPLALVTKMVAGIPAAIAAVLPGVAPIVAAAGKMNTYLEAWRKQSVHSFGAGAGGVWNSVTDYRSRQGNLADQMNQTSANFIEGSLSKQISGPSDLVAAAWEAAKAKLSSMFPELQKIGEQALANLMGVHAGDSAKKKLTSAQQKQLGDFDAWIKELAIHASAAGTDPIAEKIAAIEEQRVKLRHEADDKAKASMGVISTARVETAKSLIDKISGDETFQLLNQKTLENAKRVIKLRSELELDGQKDVDTDRINLIDDALVKELEQNRASNRQWLADKRASIQEFYGEQLAAAQKTLAALESVTMPWGKKAADEQRTVIAALLGQEQSELDAVDADKERRDKRSTDLYKQHLAEQTAGTLEWAKKTRQAILDQFGTMNQIITNTVMESRGAMATGINGFLDDLVSHQANVVKSISDLGSSLAKVWTKALTDILSNGQNVFTQLKGLWDHVNASGGNPMTGGAGGADLLNSGLAGAGIGGMIGGAFGGPNNQGALGGTIGGALGAVIGTMMGGNTALGAVIGAAIGTAIGSLIQKGQDQIKVSIKNATIAALSGQSLGGGLGDTTGDGVIDVTEHGISAAARADLFIQIRRKVKETMKGWQGILDSFPDYVKAQLAALKINPVLNLSGGVEEADIRDEQALQSLSDFLGNKLPKAAFASYTDAFKKAFEFLGAGKVRIEEMFTYFGTLQGDELQAAVKDFVTTMVAGVNWRDKFSKTPFDEQFTAANRPNTLANQMDDVNGKLALAVASMSKLTDVEDLVAAQKTVNDLAQQFWDLQTQRLQQINQIEQGLYAQHNGLREQITLASFGDDNQKKIDYFYKKLGDLREQLSRATDENSIQLIDQQMQQYIQQALGVDPNNAENQSKLMQILDDMDSLVGSRMGTVKADAQAEQQKAANMLQQAAQMLMDAAVDLNPPAAPPQSPDTPGGGTPGGGDGPVNKEPPPPPDGPNGPTMLSPAVFIASLTAAQTPMVQKTTDELERLRVDVVAAIRDAAAASSNPHGGDQPAAIAAAVRAALAEMSLVGSINDMNASIDVGTGQLLLDARDFTVQFIKRNPGSIQSRT